LEYLLLKGTKEEQERREEQEPHRNRKNEYQNGLVMD